MISRTRIAIAIAVAVILIAAGAVVAFSRSPGPSKRNVTSTALLKDVTEILRYSTSPSQLPSAAKYRTLLATKGVSHITERSGRLKAQIDGTTQCIILPGYVGEPAQPCSGTTLPNPRTTLAHLRHPTATQLENLGQKLPTSPIAGSLFLALAPGDNTSAPHTLAYGLGNLPEVFATSGASPAALYCFTYPRFVEINCSPLGKLVEHAIVLFGTHSVANAAANLVDVAYQHAQGGAAELVALRTYETLPMRQLKSWTATLSRIPNVIRFALVQRVGATTSRAVVCVLNAHYVYPAPTGAVALPPLLMGASLVGFFGNGPC